MNNKIFATMGALAVLACALASGCVIVAGNGNSGGSGGEGVGGAVGVGGAGGTGGAGQGGAGGGTGGGGGAACTESCAEASTDATLAFCMTAGGKEAETLYNAVYDCICAMGGACVVKCNTGAATDYCMDGSPEADCAACISDMAAGCGNQFAGCSNN